MNIGVRVTVLIATITSAQARGNEERSAAPSRSTRTYDGGYLGFGVISAQEGDLAEAAKAIERVVQILPVDASKRVMLAEALEKQGELKRAAHLWVFLHKGT